MDLGSPKNRAEREARDLLEFQDGLYKVQNDLRVVHRINENITFS